MPDEGVIMSFKEIPKGFERQPDGTYSKPRTRKQRKAEVFGEVSAVSGDSKESVLSDGNPKENAVTKPRSRSRTLAKSENEEAGVPRVFVLVESVRKRLLDEDNCFCKYEIDFLRYAGIIKNDSPEQTHIVVRQRRTTPEDNMEKTIVTVGYEF